MTAEPIILSARALAKRFGNVVALENADFDLLHAEVAGVIGDNAAGKSTLVRVLCGAAQPDRGEVYMRGERVCFSTPADAQRAGIEVVHQELALCPSMSVTNNIFLGRERCSRGARGALLRSLDNSRMDAYAREHLQALGVGSAVDVRRPVEALSGGQRQAIAIARASMFATSVVIMDEPLAALGVAETDRVLDLIRQFKTRGMSVTVVSHDIPRIFEIADRVHIYQAGRRVAIVTPVTCTPAQAINVMCAPPPCPSGSEEFLLHGAARSERSPGRS